MSSLPYVVRFAIGNIDDFSVLGMKGASVDNEHKTSRQYQIPIVVTSCFIKQLTNIYLTWCSIRTNGTWKRDIRLPESLNDHTLGNANWIHSYWIHEKEKCYKMWRLST